MRGRDWVRVAALVTVMLVTVTGMAPPAAGQPTPSAPASGSAPAAVPEAVPGEQVCEITDQRLVQLSGMVATEDGFIVVNDGTDFFDRKPIFVLDGSCQVVDQIGYPTPPLDPEAMVLDRERDTLWVGDTGDNAAAGLSDNQPRETVALWKIDLAGDRTPLIHRFSYPDAPRNAEALLVDGDGLPIIITLSIGTAELWQPAEAPRPNNPPPDAVPLEKVGEFTPPETGTPHDLFPAAVAGRVITGAAMAPDGTAVALRTYTDAFEFDVVDGDVVGAITTGQPRITPLPGEPQGESITYTEDGERFLTVSDVLRVEGGAPVVILRYTPTPPAPPPSPEPPAASGGSGESGGGLFSLDSPQEIINLIAAVGVVGLLMVAAGVFGIVRARRRSPPATAGPGPADPYPDGRGPAGQDPSDRGGGTVYSARGKPVTPPGDPDAWDGDPRRTPEPGWEPEGDRGQPGGRYGASRPAAGTTYGQPDRGYEESGYSGTEYGGYSGTEYSGTEYGGRSYQPERQNDGWDQGYPGYSDPDYPQDYADDYSDDPDYPYEFRERGSPHR